MLKKRKASKSTGQWRKRIPNCFTISNLEGHFNLSRTNKMLTDENIKEECLRVIHTNKSVMISSMDVPLSRLDLLFISSKNQSLAYIDSINICSVWFLIFFLLQIQSMKKLADASPKESVLVSCFSCSRLCAHLWVLWEWDFKIYKYCY